jgi:hypothetical protein
MVMVISRRLLRRAGGALKLITTTGQPLTHLIGLRHSPVIA